MPIISMFYGIIIRLYLLDNKHHNTPHFHARYAEFEASVGIEDGEILAGKSELLQVQGRNGSRGPSDNASRKVASRRQPGVV